MKKRFAIAGTFVFFIVSATTTAQEITDTSFRQKSIHNLIQFYHAAIGHQAHIYNGPLYDSYAKPFTEGHQYFQADSFITGAVFYDGLEYSNIPLKYDIIRDELVMLYHNEAYPVNLIKEKIDSFSFSGHRFVKLKKDSGTNFPGDGFYDQLYASTAIKFLAKRRKLVQENSGRSTIETKPYERNTYYILKNNVYHTVRNKNSLLNVLKDKKNDVQQYIKKNNLRFKRGFETDVLNTVLYYDQLK